MSRHVARFELGRSNLFLYADMRITIDKNHARITRLVGSVLLRFE